MIEFGLFSSNVPYIIFIAIYMLYCGASSWNKQNKEEFTLQTEVSERHFASDRSHDNKTRVYRVTSRIRFIAEKQADVNDNFPENFLSDIFYFPDNILPVFNIISDSNFSRPPPYIA